jgi:hypothetical protein
VRHWLSTGVTGEARVREEYGAPERIGLGEEILVKLLPRLAR